MPDSDIPKINVLYFASAKDITGRSSEVLDLPPTLTHLTEILTCKYGDELRKVIDHSLYAINMEYIEKKDEGITKLKDTDEIALIPPVSGG
ncbi:hypothetical protein VKS41_005507 [Umbelopsis sp. WA50703]